MELLVHFVFFVTAIAVIWFFSGVLIETISRLARGMNASGFVVAFFILGFLTSISEISVVLNATLTGAPQVAVGNLIGASLVILLLIVPILAVASGKIELHNTVTDRNLVFALLVVMLPVLSVMDGSVNKYEALILLAAYVTLLFTIRRHPNMPETDEALTPDSTKELIYYGIKTVVGAGLIFFAGYVLVQESVYFAEVLMLPKALVGLLLLSLGTNMPEIMVAVQALRRKQKGIAFGNYLGSAVTNTPIFAFLVLTNGSFNVPMLPFIMAAVVMGFGFFLFALFVRSKCTLTRGEGAVLLLFYGLFLFSQTLNIAAL